LSASTTRCTHLMSVLRAELTAQMKGTDLKTGWRR
jgi:hypothetical protein